ncbi:uncharacterized [Tachysurus ichikawai]
MESCKRVWEGRRNPYKTAPVANPSLNPRSNSSLISPPSRLPQLRPPAESHGSTDGWLRISEANSSQCGWLKARVTVLKSTCMLASLYLTALEDTWE